MIIKQETIEMIFKEKIKQKCRRKEMSLVYGFILRILSYVEWKRINRMIINRWSLSGLFYIKNLAYSFKWNESGKNNNELEKLWERIKEINIGMRNNA